MSATAPSSTIPRWGVMQENMLRIHDVTASFPGRLTGVEGLSYYHERAVLLPGTVVAKHGLPNLWLERLKTARIGARKRITIAPGHPLGGGFGRTDVDAIQRIISTGGQVEFFMPTEKQVSRIEPYIGQIPYNVYAWGPTPELARILNNKADLRRQKKEIYPKYQIFKLEDAASNPDVYDWVSGLVARYGGAMVKLCDGASGDGIKPVSGDNWRLQLQQVLQDLAASSSDTVLGFREVLIDAYYEKHIPLSVQMEIGPDGPDYLCTTLQQITNDTDHAGNLICSGELPGVPDGVVSQTKRRSLILGGSLFRQGYRGYVGFDYIYADGKLWLLEVNARVTGATYPLSVALQVQANTGKTNWSVASANLKLSQTCTYEELDEALGSRLYNSSTGTGLIVAAPGMPAKGKLILYALDHEPDGAQLRLNDASQLLGATI